MKAVVTAGTTFEPYGSGRIRLSMSDNGWLAKLVAEKFAAAGWSVKFVHGPTSSLPSAGCSMLLAEDGAKLADIFASELRKGCDVLFHAMSVTPVRCSSPKGEIGDLSSIAVGSPDSVPDPGRDVRGLVGPKCVVVGRIAENWSMECVIDQAKSVRKQFGWNYVVCESGRTSALVSRSQTWEFAKIDQAAEATFRRCLSHIEENRQPTW